MTVGLKYWVGKRDARKQAQMKLSGGAVLPFEELTDADLRIHSPIQDASEFLPRDLMVQVCDKLKEGRPVLIVGPSMAGKSRLAAEAVRRTYPVRPTVVAPSGRALVDLLDAARPEGCIVWLEDFERFLNDGLTRERTHQLLADGNLLVATIRISMRATFDVSGDFKPQGWDVFDAFDELMLDGQLSDNEMARMRQSSYAPLQDRIGTYGFAAYLGGAPAALSYYLRGKTTNPLGWASIRAAVDWYRATLKPVPDRILKSLAPAYLPPSRRFDRYNRNIELEWASKLLNDSVRLLRPGADGSWLVFDYIIDQSIEAGTQIKEEAWTAVASSDLSPPVALFAGSTAYSSGRRDVAEQLWKSAQADGSKAAALASNNLGMLHQAAGDWVKAEAFYRQAMASNDPQAAALAANNLGALRLKDGDREGAEALFRQALDSNDPRATYGAANNLGTLRLKDGDREGAEALFRQALDSNDPQAAALAANNLGLLRLDDNDREGAEALFRQALASNDPEASARAANNLGWLRLEDKDREGAEALFRQALASNDPQAAALAANNLGSLRLVDKDREGAEALFRQALASNDLKASALASLNLGWLRLEDRDQEGAEVFYRRALDSNDPETAGRATIGLGFLHQKAGDRAGAEAFYRRALDSNDPQTALVAAQCLIEMLGEGERGQPKL